MSSNRADVDDRAQRAPHLYAVVECPAEAHAFVGAVPPLPWPSHLRLCEGAPDGEVAPVVGQLARYGHGGGGPQSLAALVADFPEVTPGGLAATDCVEGPFEGPGAFG